MDVAKYSSLDGEVYELDPLPDDDSERLLRKRVFKEENGFYSELEEVTKKILKKCGGIPLAIITIASMLASISNRTKYEWYDVYNSMGSGLEKDKTLDNMRSILHLSYGDLPSYLKPCLLYLSMFPEDCDIPKGDLIRLWVAEGFVVEEQGTNYYDTGERYFNELLNRSMIMPADINEYGVARACRVHDMILDLIISLSAQENFSTTLEGLHLKSTVRKVRRISLQSEQTILPPTDYLSHARSLIVFHNVVHGMPPLAMFSFLRVLLLECVVGEVIKPKDLGGFHHLRYLKLHGKLEPELLEGIGNLKVLKTLDLEGASVEVPVCIVQIRQLECLLVDNNSKFPDGIGNLTSLQELSVLDVDESPNTLGELGKLTKLRVLTIQGLDESESYMETFMQSLSNLGNLRTLNFRGYRGPSSLDCVSDQWRGPHYLQDFNGGGITFSELPRWFYSLSELTCLSIRVNMLRQVDLQLLGASPVLRFLNLRVHPAGTTEEWLVIGSDRQTFPSLAEFRFKHYSRCWLVFGQGAMPRLQKLELFFAAQRREGGGYDAGMENLTSLKHVTIQVDCDGAMTRVVEDVETKIRDAVDRHQNQSTLVLSRRNDMFMLA